MASIFEQLFLVGQMQNNVEYREGEIDFPLPFAPYMMPFALMPS